MSKQLVTLPAVKGPNHTHFGAPESEAVCGGAVLDSFYAHTPEQRADAPTCTRCRRKWDQLNPGAQIVESDIDHDTDRPETD